MVLGSQINEKNFSPDKNRLLLKYFGKSLSRPSHAPDATGQVDAEGISCNFKIGEIFISC